MEKSEIDELLDLFDLKMISSGKKYLPLRTANEIINEIDKFKNIPLKELLQKGKIPNAYQTDTSPKQWRIPFSNIDNYTEKRKEYLRNNPKKTTQVILPIPENKNYGCFIFIIIALIIAYFYSISTDKHKANNGELNSEACIMSREFVLRQLLSPKNAEFGVCTEDKSKYLGGNRYQVTNYVDASNQFGAILRKTYYITLKFNNQGWEDINNWTLESIDIE